MCTYYYNRFCPALVLHLLGHDNIVGKFLCDAIEPSMQRCIRLMDTKMAPTVLNWSAVFMLVFIVLHWRQTSSFIRSAFHIVKDLVLLATMVWRAKLD